MSFNINSNFVLKALNVVSWIIFIGLCVEAGAIIFNCIYLFFKPEVIDSLYYMHKLLPMYQENKGGFIGLMSFAIVISCLKAYLFYIIIVLFQKLNLVKPFSEEISKLISSISVYVFEIGLIGLIAAKFTERLINWDYEVGNISKHWNDSEAFLMMAAILFVIAQIFKKGMELQNENDLTV